MEHYHSKQGQQADHQDPAQPTQSDNQFNSVLVDELDMLLTQAASIIHSSKANHPKHQRSSSQDEATQNMYDAWHHFNTQQRLETARVLGHWEHERQHSLSVPEGRSRALPESVQCWNPGRSSENPQEVLKSQFCLLNRQMTLALMVPSQENLGAGVSKIPIQKQVGAGGAEASIQQQLGARVFEVLSQGQAIKNSVQEQLEAREIKTLSQGQPRVREPRMPTWEQLEDREVESRSQRHSRTRETHSPSWEHLEDRKVDSWAQRHSGAREMHPQSREEVINVWFHEPSGFSDAPTPSWEQPGAREVGSWSQGPSGGIETSSPSWEEVVRIWSQHSSGAQEIHFPSWEEAIKIWSQEPSVGSETQTPSWKHLGGREVESWSQGQSGFRVTPITPWEEAIKTWSLGHLEARETPTASWEEVIKTGLQEPSGSTETPTSPWEQLGTREVESWSQEHLGTSETYTPPQMQLKLINPWPIAQSFLASLISKALTQREVKDALIKILASEVLGTYVAKALPQRMLKPALMRALSQKDLGNTITKALFQPKVRVRVAKTLSQGELGAALSRVLMPEEKEDLIQAILKGELGSMVIQALAKGILGVNVNSFVTLMTLAPSEKIPCPSEQSLRTASGGIVSRPAYQLLRRKEIVKVPQRFSEREESPLSVASWMDLEANPTQKINEEQLWAILVIQSYFRGFKVRQNVAQQHMAATFIQSIWKGLMVRRTLGRHNTAAIIIQAAWRGYTTRKSMTWDQLSTSLVKIICCQEKRPLGHCHLQPCQTGSYGTCGSELPNTTLGQKIDGPPGLVLSTCMGSCCPDACGCSTDTDIACRKGRGPRLESGKLKEHKEPEKPSKWKQLANAATVLQAAWRGYQARRALW
ncbi:IQ domain-containing protein N [Tachyglossus aculeatus]|uniref:IQ domain-containing protein N n=1 Tax=Tachyglossus aculeatus TaxID=9261 RepID=UPI0018F3FD62|nr:IQ domain-containing protein N [Tachyglossus aculeatus]